MPKFQTKRSIEIMAPPEDVFQRVADFNTWTTWSPWLCAEPDAKVTVSDDSNSVGSVYAWEGELVGAGEIEHRILEPGEHIVDEIRFKKPFQSRSDVSFDFQEILGGTRVTWGMNGSLPWFLFWMRKSMEAYIGMDYSRGLLMLKQWIETGEIHSKTSIEGIQSVGPMRMVGISRSGPLADVGRSVQESFRQLDRVLSAEDAAAAGPAITVYHRFDVVGQQFQYTSGYVMPESQEPLPEGLSQWRLPECKALKVQHVGEYQHLGNAWSAANQYARYKKLKQSRVGTYEIYRTRPPETPPSELLTEIHLPLR